jgi:hypothetical protein
MSSTKVRQAAQLGNRAELEKLVNKDVAAKMLEKFIFKD